MAKRNKPARSTGAPYLLSEGTNFLITEAYKTARTNIMFALSACEKNVLTITSCNAGEGKSTAAVNLAIAFSQIGKRVLLIDADMRKPTCHRILKLSNTAGLSSVLGHFASLDECVTYGVNGGIDVITAGAIPPNPAELLTSPRMAELIAASEKEYDYVIIDSPPVNVVSDALIIGKLSGGIALILREGETGHNDIEKALRAIKFADVRVLGFIKAFCTPSDSSRYKRGYYKYGKRYGYGYGYGSDDRGESTEPRKG